MTRRGGAVVAPGQEKKKEENGRINPSIFILAEEFDK